MDQLVFALYQHHRDEAPKDLVARFLPAPTDLPTRVPVKPRVDWEKFKAFWIEKQKAKRKIVRELTPEIYPTVQEIMTAVGTYYGVSVTDIKSSRRTREVSMPRQVAYYLARKMTIKSLPDIGRHMGGKDHTSVLWGCRVIEEKMRTDKDFAAQVDRIRSALDRNEVAA